MSLKLPPDIQAVTAFYWNKDPTRIFLSSILHPGLSTLSLEPDNPSSPWTALNSLDTGQSGLTLESMDTFSKLHLGPLTQSLDLDSLSSPWTLDSLASTWTPGGLVILDYIYEHFILVTRNEDASHKKQDSVITEIIQKPDFKNMILNI